MIDDTRSAVNGWTIEEVVRDWFERTDAHDMNGRHAARDGHMLGNSIMVRSVEVIEDCELDGYLDRTKISPFLAGLKVTRIDHDDRSKGFVGRNHKL